MTGSSSPLYGPMKGMKPVKNPPNILAVVIGINKYTGGAGYNNLTGAVGDADCFEDFLTTRLQVPKQNIRSLRDSSATRTAILDAFTFLRDADTDPEKKYEIIIYYAGHGAQEDIPEDWKDWYTPTGRIEMLCPSDIGSRRTVTRNGQSIEELVPGIPDRTIAVLLNQISLRKGNHITVILDCCSSAGMNRGGSGMDTARLIPRQIYNAPPINSSLDQEFLQCGPRGTHSKEYAGRFRASHVLLAACGREQLAWEDPTTRRGLFTYGLLKILAGDELETLTYRSLMDKLNMPMKQTPHCEGEGVNQLLFGNRQFGADTKFIYGKRAKDGPITIEAGAAQGITLGTRFSIHRTNIIDTSFLPNPCLGYLVATSITNFSATLEPPPGKFKFRPPLKFYCKAVHGAPHTTALYCKDSAWLHSLFPFDDWEKRAAKIVDNPATCDLELVVEDDMVYFERRDKIISPVVGSRLPQGVLLDDAEALYRVVKAASHFTYHLTRTAPWDADNVRMEVNELQPEYSGGFEECVYKPVGRNLLAEEPATIEVDDQRSLGLTIINDSNTVLYPYLFYFDPNDFTITEWYTPPLGAGHGRLTPSSEIEIPAPSPSTDPSPVSDADNTGMEIYPSSPDFSSATSEPNRLKIGVDAALPPKSHLGVGYSSSGSQPWRFFIPEGQTQDIGFFRLFLSTRPGNFQSIVQESPFETRRGGGAAGLKEGPEAEMWMVKSATVVQVQAPW